ncbi:MAG: alpha/beta fold hydrolase [Acidobacteria bacterium]|nr:alpha/beta fold hydrolase [Acidobacteriota bacterium]
MLRLGLVSFVMAVAAAGLTAQDRPLQAPTEPGSASYLVFLRQQPVGREEVTVVRSAEGWTVRGTSQLGVPVDITTRRAEIRYDAEWHPVSVLVNSLARGQELELRTTFADGKASNEIIAQGKTTPKVDDVSADAVVLPNTFLGSYAALAHRLRGLAVNAELRAYVAPQIEVPVRVAATASERIDTPKESIAATRFSLKIVNPPPAGELDAVIWIDEQGRLLRLSIPGQALEMAREDIASAATRTASFSIPGDERVSIPTLGFNLAGTITKPAGATGQLPAIVLIGGSGPTDRDETVFGIPVFGHLAKGLVEAGFTVVRYDKRGVGQSGGRAESATLNDYAEDARAVVRWLERRKDVDRNRIAVVGHSEGAAVAMILATREDRVKAVVLIAGTGTTGAELVLEQQRHQLDVMKVDASERAAKIALQEQIQAAVLKGTGWEGVPDGVRKVADTPWFQSMLSFDPARVMKDVDQPVLIVQGELDVQVPPHHAEKLLAMAQARKRNVDEQLLKVPGVNHLLVPAKTGEVSEYASLSGAEVAPAIPAGVGSWLAKTLGPGRK